MSTQYQHKLSFQHYNPSEIQCVSFNDNTELYDNGIFHNLKYCTFVIL